MARFSAILPATVVVIACFYMIDFAKAAGEQCSTPDGCGVCPTGIPECCDGLRQGMANNGSVEAQEYGKCTCCSSGQICETIRAASLSHTPSTQTDANAVDVDCKAK